MDYEWDPHKAATNLRKHGIRFADAVSVLEDNFAITIEDDNPDEQRFITIGMNMQGLVLLVVYTWRGTSIRVISARKATAHERAFYEEVR